MIKLLKFGEEDFQLLKSWIKSDEELIQFAGAIFSFPLTDEQLSKYINTNHFKPFKILLLETNEVIGHCELNFENGNRRLSRILIGNKNLRGKNIGEAVVKEMLNLLFDYPNTTQVDLNVFDWNKPAIRCYEKVGFSINQNNIKEVKVNGKTWKAINMVIKVPSVEKF